MSPSQLSRSGIISTTTLAVVGVSALLVVAGGVGLVEVAGSQPPAPAPAKSPADKKPAPAEQPKKTDDAKKDAPKGGAKDAYVLGFKVKDIDGKDVDLSQYKGRVVVIVNVASQCGYTPQYESLEKLYKDKKDKGLVILGFPANDFGKQEPGSESEIKEFCTSKYNISFPMFSKITVKGEGKNDLYQKLTAQPAPVGGDPKWNFTKFVVDRSGNVVARYDAKGDGGSRANLEPDLLKKVDELLAAK